MIKKFIKKYPALGCCGLDCGLCPRYYTQGPSRCPGCAGPNFFQKNPGCTHITCCLKKKNLEVCAQCEEFPCPKFNWLTKKGGKTDSFLTHQKIYQNLIFIKKHGLKPFIRQQKKRIKLLETMLQDFDEGWSKSFYCLATTLLAPKDLEKALKNSQQEVKKEKIKPQDKKAKAKILRSHLHHIAKKKKIMLKLRKLKK